MLEYTVNSFVVQRYKLLRNSIEILFTILGN